MFNLILFGPPGSGKGTQASKIEKKYGLEHISTGDLFRHELKNNTEIGKRVKGFLDSGELVPDSITIEILKNKIQTYKDPNGFLLDGFPRNCVQAATLDEFFSELDMEISILISLDVSEEEIVGRILNRGKTSGRSDDNDESIIRGRYKVYTDVTSPVFNHYLKLQKAKAVNGVGSIDEIFNRLVCTIDECKDK